jgi:hypothetical protein
MGDSWSSSRKLSVSADIFRLDGYRKDSILPSPVPTDALPGSVGIPASINALALYTSKVFVVETFPKLIDR